MLELAIGLIALSGSSRKQCLLYDLLFMSLAISRSMADSFEFTRSQKALNFARSSPKRLLISPMRALLSVRKSSIRRPN